MCFSKNCVFRRCTARRELSTWQSPVQLEEDYETALIIIVLRNKRDFNEYNVLGFDAQGNNVLFNRPVNTVLAWNFNIIKTAQLSNVIVSHNMRSYYITLYAFTPSSPTLYLVKYACNKNKSSFFYFIIFSYGTHYPYKSNNTQYK